MVSSRRAGGVIGAWWAVPARRPQGQCSRSASNKPAAIPVGHNFPPGALPFFETTTRVEAERSVQVTSEGMGKCLKYSSTKATA